MFVAQVRGDIEGVLKTGGGEEERRGAREKEMARHLYKCSGCQNLSISD